MDQSTAHFGRHPCAHERADPFWVLLPGVSPIGGIWQYFMEKVDLTWLLAWDWVAHYLVQDAASFDQAQRVSETHQTKRQVFGLPTCSVGL